MSHSTQENARDDYSHQFMTNKTNLNDLSAQMSLMSVGHFDDDDKGHSVMQSLEDSREERLELQLPSKMKQKATAPQQKPQAPKSKMTPK